MELNDRSTIWPYDEQGEPREFFYTRYAHPAGAAAEAKLGELEGGEALLFASGMAAETAVVLAFARPGTTIALARRRLLRDVGSLPLARALGPPVRRVRPDRTAARERRDRLGRVAGKPDADHARLGGAARSPGSRRLRRDRRDADLPARARRGRRCHDPLGHEVPHGESRSSARCRRDARSRAPQGAAPHPDADRRRRLASLGGGAARRARIALPAACATSPRPRPSSRDASTSIRPSSSSATRGTPGVISFDVADPRRVETGTRVIVNATSLGGVTSTMESRHRWEGDRIPEGLLRLSVGLEDVDELWADLVGALS